MNTQSNRPIELDHLASLHVTGKDATRFLHAQFTNDLERLPVGDWQYSGYCTPKGRLLAFMTILRQGDSEYRLIVDRSVIDTFLPRLRMFVLRDDVTIEPDEGHIVGVMGTGNASSMPAGLARIALDDQRALIIGTAEAGEPDGADDWILRDIEAGIPTITAATQEAFVPQMVNLDLIGAVNFKKGCYPGQEVVARVHYLGRTKQRMFLLNTSGNIDLKPGDKIDRAGDPGNAAGTVVNSATDGSATRVLAVLQTRVVQEKEPLQCGDTEGIGLSVEDLPYAIPELEPEASETQQES